MTTKELLELIEDHARLAFKEGKHFGTEKQVRYATTRHKILQLIKLEIDPYAASNPFTTHAEQNLLECSARHSSDRAS